MNGIRVPTYANQLWVSRRQAVSNAWVPAITCRRWARIRVRDTARNHELSSGAERMKSQACRLSIDMALSISADNTAATSSSQRAPLDRVGRADEACRSERQAFTQRMAAKNPDRIFQDRYGVGSAQKRRRPTLLAWIIAIIFSPMLMPLHARSCAWRSLRERPSRRLVQRASASQKEPPRVVVSRPLDHSSADFAFLPACPWANADRQERPAETNTPLSRCFPRRDIDKGTPHQPSVASRKP